MIINELENKRKFLLFFPVSRARVCRLILKLLSELAVAEKSLSLAVDEGLGREC